MLSTDCLNVFYESFAPLLNYYIELHTCLVKIQSMFWRINQKLKAHKALRRQVDDDEEEKKRPFKEIVGF